MCQCYKVSVEQAVELGTRRMGRRPDLPASQTAKAVSGKTLEELWEERPRDDMPSIMQFYEDVGAWFTFTQVYYHRNRNHSRFFRGLPDGARFCEYGAGVAPLCFWLVTHERRRTFHLNITDVPSEHLRFGEWRLKRHLAATRLRHSLTVQEIHPGHLPLEGLYDALTILQVFEHLPNPLEVMEHLTAHLKPGGKLWENYLKNEPGAADLAVAQAERPAVIAHLRQHYRLLSGRDPDEDPGDTRCWLKRQAA